MSTLDLTVQADPGGLPAVAALVRPAVAPKLAVGLAAPRVGVTIELGDPGRPGVAVALPRGPQTVAIGVPAATLALEIAVQQGLRGPRGTWGVDRALLLRQLSLPIQAGRVAIDFSEANTYYLLLTEDVGEVVFVGTPAAGVTSRVQIYVQQDEVGGRSIRGWPRGTRTPSGAPPDLSLGPGDMDSLVLDTFDGGATTQLNLVGQDYTDLN